MSAICTTLCFTKRRETCNLLCPTNETHLSCLHYVFIPRINAQLKVFMQAWNNHSMRTEHGMTPAQIWTRGLALSDLEQPVSEDYGIDDFDGTNPFDDSSVEVPEVLTQLSNEQLALSKLLSTTAGNSKFKN